MRTVHLQKPKKRVIPHAAFKTSPSSKYIRDYQAALYKIAHRLAEARLARFGRRTSQQEIDTSVKKIEKLHDELDDRDGNVTVRIWKVVDWYASQPWEDKTFKKEAMIPWVQAGLGLYERFDRLEGVMLSQQSQFGEGMDEVDIIEMTVYPDDRRASERFVREIVEPAKQLHLGSVKDETHVAAVVGTLYNAIRKERERFRLDSDAIMQLGGPIGLVKRYIAWVAEQHWAAGATVNVLDFESNAFAQFRRECAQHDPLGRDPITGRYR